MGFIDKIKRDITRHRHKAAILGVLLLVMATMTLRAIEQLRHGDAAFAIAPIAPTGEPAKDDPAIAGGGADAEEQIRQSKELWKRLREVSGIDASVAFSFDSSFYPPDPTRHIVTSVPERIEPVPATPVIDNSEAIRRSHESSIRQQSETLTVQSTTVNGSNKPWAIINQQLISVGDKVNGFEVTAIRSREVDFQKDGVNITRNMPDDLRGK